MRTIGWGLWLAACREPAVGDGRPDPVADDTDPGLPSPTAETGLATTGTTGDTAEPSTGTELMPWERSTFDCSTVPRGEVSYTRLSWAPSAEDFTLSGDGFLYGVQGGILQKVPYGGPSDVVLPGLGDVRGTRFLPDGRLALSHPEDGCVWLVDPTTGSAVPAACGLNTPNGLAIDPEGRIAVASQQRIVRIDPATGDVEELAAIAGRSFDGIVYSPDFRRLYFNEELGRIHWIDFAEDGSFTLSPTTIQMDTSLLGFAILDGMAMDVCGNLYANMMDGRVWRVWPDGTQEVVADIRGLAIIPALNFGLPARDGWVADHLYVMDFMGALYDLPIGVPGKWEPHLPVPPSP